MPRFQFLSQNQKLNKNNFIDIINNLRQRATREPEAKPTETAQFFARIEVKKDYDRLLFFIKESIKKLSYEASHNFTLSFGLDDNEIRRRLLLNMRDKLQDFAPETNERRELIALLDDENANQNIIIDELVTRTKNLLPDIYKDEVSSKEISIISNPQLINRFDDFVNLVKDDLNEQEIEALGDLVNNYKSVFEYELNDNYSKTIYDDKTEEIINRLKETKMLDGKALTDDEINEYSEALRFSNKLFSEPTIDFAALLSEKINLENAVDHDLANGADDRLRNMGYDPEVVSAGFEPNLGPHYDIIEGKENEFNSLRDNMELSFSPDTKKGIKEILTKMHEFGFDKNGITGEEGTKIYGLKALYDAGSKYKEAMNSENPQDRIKAAIYAKEIVEADRKIKELFNLIDKYMPITENNLGLPGNVDSIRTEEIPPIYRLDYVRVSHLAGLYSLSNLIESKKWPIDDFLEHPMRYLKEYYKEDYLYKSAPAKRNEGLTGNDLMFSIGRYTLEPDVANMLIGGGRIVECLYNIDKDLENRKNNAAVYKAFENIFFTPYNTANMFRDRVARTESLDNIIINPNITFSDLHIKTYDAEEMKFVEPEKEEFDEISYLRQMPESLAQFKERIDESILSYIKKEIALVKENQSTGVMHIESSKYIDLVAKAVAKVLTVRRFEKDSQAYQELEGMIRNKSNYVNRIFDSIEENGKYSEYISVKNMRNNPLIYNNTRYNPTVIGTFNKLNNTLTDFDNYVNNNKRTVNTELNEFINSEKNLNNNLKNIYNSYLDALNKYNAEVRKIYGANYKGEINNFSNDKIRDAFSKKEDLYKEFLKKKEDIISNLENRIRENNNIPISYYEDRKLQLENNYFNEIPPLFRSDKPLTMDEYIKLSHPNDYQSLSNDEKNIIFESYKKKMMKLENDYFSRKFLVSKNLTKEKEDIFEIQRFEKNEINHQRVNQKMLEAQLIGVSADEIINNHIGEDNHKFDELKFMMEFYQKINDFKKNLDKKLFDFVKEYKEALNDKEALEDLPKIEDVIDVFQKATMKYLLVVADYEKNNSNYNHLKKFIIDAKGYINDLIKDENNKIDERNGIIVAEEAQDLLDANQNEGNIALDNLEEKLTFKASDLHIDDSLINNYYKQLIGFDSYYKDIKENDNLPLNLKEREDYYNNILKTEFDKLNKFERLKNLNHEEADAEDILANIGNKFRKVNYDQEIANSKNIIKNSKKHVKELVGEAFKNGLISKYYLTERYNRLDKNDFSLPPLHAINKLPSIDSYVKEKYPNDYNNLTNDEKKNIYTRYKNECEEERRQFYLRKYLIDKNLTDRQDYSCELLERFNEQKQNQIDEIIEIKDPQELFIEKLSEDIKKDDSIDEYIDEVF